MRRLVVIALGMLCFAGAAQAVSLYSEGFDTYTTGNLTANGWTNVVNNSVPYNSHDFTVITGQHQAGTKALQTPAGGWFNTFSGLPSFLVDQQNIGPFAVGLTDEVIYSYYVKFSSAFLGDTAKAPSVGFQVNDGTSLTFDSYISATMTSTADKIQIEGGAGYTDSSSNFVLNRADFTETVNSTTWYELSADVYNGLGRADFYFGNTLLGSASFLPGADPNIASVDVFFDGGASGDTAYMDTLSVSDIPDATAFAGVPEPATMTLMGLGLAGLIGRQIRRRRAIR